MRRRKAASLFGQALYVPAPRKTFGYYHLYAPKKLRFVQQRPSKAPKLFLIEGRLGGRPGGLCVLPTLFIEGSDGGFSEEMIKIYGDYKEGYV